MGKGIAVSMVVMIVLLALAVGYIGYDKYTDWKIQKDNDIYQGGINYGYELAVTQMFSQVGSCQQVPLTVENQTLKVIAIECLQQAQVPAVE
jgi:hypothetical protein